MSNKNIRIALLIAGCVLTLASCSLLRPYTPPIDQGKHLNAKSIQNLHPGMSMKQIAYILGTPDIQDPFNTNNWYYVYTYQSTPASVREQKTLALEFKNGKLTEISGNYPPPQEINQKSN
jgi:outer membrane protein assembly factor BamE